MPQKRFFIDITFEKGKKVTFPDEERHHLSVMRCKINDKIEMINGRNQLAKATIVSLSAKSASLVINEIFTNKAPTISINLYQSFCHFNRLDTILEKSVELGATNLYLFPSDLSEIKIPSNRKNRLKKVIISAMKQCGRLDFLNLNFLKDMKSIELTGTSFFGDIKKSSDYLTKHFSPDKNFNIFIGPEKGFSDRETDILENKFDAKGIHLNPNILRTDTAAICFLSQLQLLIHG